MCRQTDTLHKSIKTLAIQRLRQRGRQRLTDLNLNLHLTHTETQTERQTETHRHQMPADPDTHKHTEIHTHTTPPPSVLTSFSQHLTHDNTDEDGGREPPSKKEIKIAPDTRKKRKKNST